MHLQHLHLDGSTRSFTGQDEQTVFSAGTSSGAVSYGFSGDCRPGTLIFSTRGMRQLNESSPCRTITEYCWLSSKATWQHGERPADSWGTEGCQENRGGSRVSLGRDDRAASKRVSSAKHHPAQSKKYLFLPPIVKTQTSHRLDVAGFQFVQIRQKHGYQDNSISSLVLKCIMGPTTCDLTADIHLKKRASLSQAQSDFHECHKLDNGCILKGKQENGTGTLNYFKAI